MRRREFISLLAVATVALPRIVRAQQATKIPRIGVLSPSRSDDASPNRVVLKAFVAWLRELGYVEGQTLPLIVSLQTRMPINFAKPLLNW